MCRAEIAELVEEMFEVDTRLRPSAEEDELQAAFEAITEPFHPTDASGARIGSGFLVRHHDLLVS